ncbi:MAG TPA: hypothetical protein VF375_01580 [Candidatus Limnocylindrales bacterium]
MAETSTKAVEMQVSEKRRDATSIQLEYRVANGTAEPIYLLDRPSQDVHGGGMVIVENFANVLFAAPDAVRIIRGILPLPLDRNVARRAPTFLTKVEAGQAAVRSLQIALPLVERRSYFSDDEKPTGVKRLVSKVRFELAYTELRPGMKIGQRTLASGPEALLDGRWDPPYQRVLTFTFAIAPIELMLHSDPYERAELVQ